MIIYTIGHGRTDIDEFIGFLQRYNIELLVDVRSVPFSRWAPLHNKNSIKKFLQDKGIRYLWRGNVLGGLDSDVSEKKYQDEMDLLIQGSTKKTIALMCSEIDHTKCHRYYKLTRYLELKNLSVSHIKRDGLLAKKEVNHEQLGLFK